MPSSSAADPPARPRQSCSRVPAGRSRVVEKATFPRRKVCGEFISATNALLLRELGVGEPYLHPAGPEVRRVGLFAWSTIVDLHNAEGRATVDRLGEGAWARNARPPAPGSARQVKARMFGNHGAPSPCSRPPEAADACTISGEREGAPASTRPSSLRRTAPGSAALPTLPARRHHPSDLLAFKAHFDGCDLPPDLMPLLAFPGGYGGMVQCDGGRVSLSCCIRRDVLEERRRGGRQRARCRRGLPAHPAVLRRRAPAPGRARLRDKWLAAGPIDPGIRAALRRRDLPRRQRRRRGASDRRGRHQHGDAVGTASGDCAHDEPQHPGDRRRSGVCGRCLFTRMARSLRSAHPSVGNSRQRRNATIGVGTPTACRARTGPVDARRPLERQGGASSGSSLTC